MRWFALGFAIGELEGRASYGHGGAIYGFATQLCILDGAGRVERFQRRYGRKPVTPPAAPAES